MNIPNLVILDGKENIAKVISIIMMSLGGKKKEYIHNLNTLFMNVSI